MRIYYRITIIIVFLVAMIGTTSAQRNIELALAAQKCFESKKLPNGNNNYHQFLTLVHFTDMHGDSVRCERIFSVAEQLGATAVCTGDMIYSRSTDDYSWMDRMIRNYPYPYMHCLGNHDVWNFYQDSLGYNKYIRPYADLKDWKLGDAEYPTYYTRDDTTHHIRFIALNQWCCQPNVKKQHNYVYYTQAQIDWFLKELMTTPKDYGVILLIHTPELRPVMDKQYTKFYQKEPKPGQKFFDKRAVQPLKDIVDAFMTGTALNKTYIDHDTIRVNVDFKNAQSRDFIAYLSGHLHTDNVYYERHTTHKTSQLMLNAVCACNWIEKLAGGRPNPYLNEINDLARQDGTDLQDAFNVYILDYHNRQIRIIRIGSDMPCDLSEKRDYMVIPYSYCK